VKFVQDVGRAVTYRLSDATESMTGEGATVSPTRRSPSPPPLDGEIRFDDQAQAAAAEDFGHLVHHTPEGVVLPASDEDVAAAVRWAAERGRSFAAQGQRHSVFGRAQVRDGVVADMGRLRTVHAVEPDRVVVDAGATLREVLAATLPRGLAPPGLPDYLDLSVGGTLVVGGVDSAISRFGVLTDNVLELQVVTGRGERLTYSPTSNPRQFDAVRAGLGQVAVVTAAVEAVAAGELARLTPADLGPLGQVVISPILRESVRTPLLRLPPDPVCYTFNLIRLPATDDVGGAHRAADPKWTCRPVVSRILAWQPSSPTPGPPSSGVSGPTRPPTAGASWPRPRSCSPPAAPAP
jgi:hypothetical protein